MDISLGKGEKPVGKGGLMQWKKLFRARHGLPDSLSGLPSNASSTGQAFLVL